ncbi:MAG: agmatine deiminase family protein [Sphingomonadaceae bacterium]|nr:agmatine deiminase family protein [Sphingomonadaceae bacterium]NBU78695.1 agmatine deiminase family protein [Sphingomonadaceae bacterium]
MSRIQPAEWAPHDSVWIGFPSAADLWLEDLEGAQAEVAAFANAVYAGGKGEAVRLVCANPEAEAAARALASPGIEIVAAPFFDIWLRDTGPIIVSDNGKPLALDYPGNGWGGKYPSPLDDDLARLLCDQAGLPRQPRDWILEGGAIDVDGAGLCVTTGQCLLNPNRNPKLSRRDIEDQLRADLGLKEVLWLGVGLLNDHTDGHVDNLARFVAPGVLALPEAFGDDDPNADIFADALARAKDWPVEIALIPSAGLHADEDGEPIPASHMNFYIGNATVVVPTYGGPSDDAAVAAIAKLFPDRETIGLPANHILTGGGSFHCISQQVPKI